LKNRNILIVTICSLLIIQILIYPKECINYTLSGTKLFFYSVFPSLFPFLVISNIIIAYEGVKIYANVFGNILCAPLRLPKECSIALIISFLCGYPLGAKYSFELYENNIITYETYERLLNIASNPGPLFVIGAVGTTMLHNTYLGYLLLVSSYISCFLVSFFIPNKSDTINRTKPVFAQLKTNNIGVIIKDSVDNAISTTLYIGGFIIVFYVLTSIIKSNAIFSIALNKTSVFLDIPLGILQGTLLGFLEMTNGSFLISNSDSKLIITSCIISFLITFSGMSVIAQVYSFTYKLKFNLKKYVYYKFLQGILSSMSCFILITFAYSNKTISIFFNSSANSSNPILYILLCIILIFPLIVYITKKLLDVS